MIWWQNLPFFSIIGSLLSASIAFILPRKRARHFTLLILGLDVLSGLLLLHRIILLNAGPFVFQMGHFPMPWGNVIRCGVLEAFLASFFPAVMLCAVAAGQPSLEELSEKNRESLSCAIVLLLITALLAQIYSNDLFTCYVFLEIMTLTACALIVLRDSGRALMAGMRYMVLNLVGSGLFLLGIVLLYSLTGHLLMEPLHSSIQALSQAGTHHRSLTIILALMTVGLCVKSALFPFHSWVPDAYSSALPSSNAILSSLVSKGYILLLLKIYVRVFGWDLVLASRVDHLLLLFSLSGLVVGSLEALRTTHFLRMIAWSSVAQIGYIYLGLALGAGLGYRAALFHLCVHAAAKSLLFLSADMLQRVSENRDRIQCLRGAARRSPVFGLCWTIAAFSMVGLPFTGGLISKLLLGEAALSHSRIVAIISLLALALSSFLHILYFLRTVILLWSPDPETTGPVPSVRVGGTPLLACCTLAVASIALFFLADPLLQLFSLGLSQF
ncbi:MAG: sodium:proton antiporter [Clostridia bacterium]|nr:sodium:proton antiporter [Clostridia bacterium]